MITDQIRQQENFLDAELKAAMANIALQALIDPEDFEKRFSQLPEEDKAIISEEFSKFCDDLAKIKDAQKAHTSTASPVST